MMFTALLGVGTTAFFAVPVWLVNHAPRAFVNVPTARYWGAARAPRPDARTRQADMWLLGGWTVLLLTAVQLLLVRAAGMAQPSRGRAGQPMERLDDLDRRPDSHGHSSHMAIVTPECGHGRALRRPQVDPFRHKIAAVSDAAPAATAGPRHIRQQLPRPRHELTRLRPQDGDPRE